MEELKFRACILFSLKFECISKTHAHVEGLIPVKSDITKPGWIPLVSLPPPNNCTQNIVKLINNLNYKLNYRKSEFLWSIVTQLTKYCILLFVILPYNKRRVEKVFAVIILEFYKYTKYYMSWNIFKKLFNWCL